MNDTAVLEQLRDSLAEVHMDVPLEAVVARGRVWRRRRRRLATTGVVATVALATGLVGVWHASSSPTPPPAASPQLVAFTISETPTGATALTLRKGKQYRLDPHALRQALAAHGIPAVVTVGQMCDTSPEPDGLDAAVSARRDADGAVFLTIDPAALPAGAELSIGYYTSGTRFALIDAGAPLRCGDSGPTAHSASR